MERTNFGKPREVYYRPFTLLNDPSMTAWGWSIIDKYEDVIACGAIKTKPTEKKLRVRKGDDNIRRIREINIALDNIIKEYEPALIISELPHGSQNAIAAVMLGCVLGILETKAVSKDIPIEWFSEADSKLAACGKRSITKDAMVSLMNEKHKKWKPVNIKWIDQAIADSLALYEVAKNQSNILQMMIKDNA